MLGANENSARVRVVRAVEKLRGFFRKRGVAVRPRDEAQHCSQRRAAAPPALVSALSAPTALAGDPVLRSCMRCSSDRAGGG